MKITTQASSTEEWAPFKAKWDGFVGILEKTPLIERRKAFLEAPLALTKNSPIPGKDIEITHRTVPVRDGAEIEVRIFRSLKAKNDGKSALFLKIHGGGWSEMGHNVEEPENRFLATIPNVLVVSTTYRFAPEHKFPQGLNDCFDVLQWCKANATTLGIDPERIIVGGGSAGGNLSAALVLMALSPATKTTGIIAQYLNHPGTCHPAHYPTEKHKFSSIEENADAPILTKASLMQYWNWYMSPEEGGNIFASPLLAGKDLLKGAPKTFIVVAGTDPLHDDGIAYAQALEEAGVDVKVDEYPGLPHCFFLEPDLPSSEPFHMRAVKFVKSVVGES